jgi:hypothetical protein
MPTTLHAKMHIGDPTVSGAAAPAAETDRVSFTRTTSTVGTCSNVAALTWTAVAAAETYSHITLWDAATSGNAWWFGPLVTPRAVLVGIDFTIAIGDLDLSMT